MELRFTQIKACAFGIDQIQIGDMQVEWKLKGQEPYLDFRVAEWPGVKVRRARVLPGIIPEHSSEFHEISVSLAGKLKTVKGTSTGRRKITCVEGENICLTPAGQFIGAEWDEPIDNIGLFVDASTVSDFALENGFSPNVKLREVYEGNDQLIKTIAFSLLENAGDGTHLDRLYADSLIQSLTLHLLTNYSESNGHRLPKAGGLSGYKLRRVTEFIDANLESDLGLAELAAAAGLSTFHFARSFRVSTGQTPQQYVMRQRIERAKHLLSRPEIPLVEVGFLSGFKTQSHFTALFRKSTTLTPKLWRAARTG